MSAIEATSSLHEARTQHLFLTRGLVAIAWAAVFAAVADSPTTAVTVGAGVLVVVYPLIDVIASLIDARTQHGSARRLLLANAAVSAVAALALGVPRPGASRTSSRSSAHGPPSAVRRSSSSRSAAVRSGAVAARPPLLSPS